MASAKVPQTSLDGLEARMNAPLAERQSVPPGGLGGPLRLHQHIKGSPGLRHEADFARNIACLMVKRSAGGENGTNPRPLAAHCAHKIQSIHQAGQTDIREQEGNLLSVVSQIVESLFRTGGLNDLEV